MLARLLLTCSLVAALPAVGSAAFLVTPNANAAVEGNSNNGFPFNLTNFGLSSQRYQQLYAASQFASVGGPLQISEIRFRIDGSTGSAFAGLPQNVQINLSTTAATLGGISATFASNIGGNNTTVFSGLLSLSSAGGPSPAPFDIVIALTTPFTYNPSAGNLLLDVRNFSGGSTTQFDAVGSSAVTSRVFTNTVNGVNDLSGITEVGGGLVTGFTFQPVQLNAVPAPAGLVLAFLGAPALGLLRRRMA